MKRKYKSLLNLLIVILLLCSVGCHKATDKDGIEYQIELLNPNFSNVSAKSAADSSDFISSAAAKSAADSSSFISSSSSDASTSASSKMNLDDYSSKIVDGRYTISANEEFNLYHFNGLKDLSVILVDDANTKYCSIDGILYSKDKKTLLKCPRGYEGKIIIPDGVEVIDDMAFYLCYKITEATIPDSVIELGDNAFYGCEALERVSMPSYIETMGVGVFYRCNALKDIIKR